jgi:hypothetical protein
MKEIIQTLADHFAATLDLQGDWVASMEIDGADATDSFENVTVILAEEEDN